MRTYRYLYQCYRMLRYLDEVGRLTWATHVRKLLICMDSFMCGFMKMLDMRIYFLNNLDKDSLIVQCRITHQN